jgi:hypothetical protein
MATKSSRTTSGGFALARIEVVKMTADLIPPISTSSPWPGADNDEPTTA